MKGSSNKRISLRRTSALAMLVAISIVLGKYLQFPLGDVMRFSLENLPVIFAGIAFGPLSALLVATVADIIGCLMVGYAINPIVTLGAGVVGLLSGIGAWMFGAKESSRTPISVILTVLLAHLGGSVVIKTLGLAAFYSFPPLVLMGYRAINYLIVGALESVLLIFLLRNKGVAGQIDKINGN